MAKSLTITKIERRNGTVIIHAGKYSREFPGGLQGVRDWLAEKAAESDEFLLAIGLAAYLARDTDASNPSLIVGKTITLDLAGKLNYPDSVLKVG